MDALLNNITAAATAMSLGGAAWEMLIALLGLDLILAILLNLGETDHLRQLIKLIFKYGAWIFLVREWPYLVNVVINSLTQAGAIVGGADASTLMHPDQILLRCLKILGPYWDYLSSGFNLSISGTIGIFFAVLFGAIGIFVAYLLIALQCFLTVAEFYISSALLLIFVPFGVWKHTSFLAERAFGAVISYGVKFMMLAVIYGLCDGTLNSIDTSYKGAVPTWHDIFIVLAQPWAIALLAWNAPGMAAGLMSGSPSLSGGSALGFAASAGAGMVGTAMMGKSIASGTLNAARAGINTLGSRNTSGGGRPGGSGGAAAGGLAGIRSGPEGDSAESFAGVESRLMKDNDSSSGNSGPFAFSSSSDSFAGTKVSGSTASGSAGSSAGTGSSVSVGASVGHGSSYNASGASVGGSMSGSNNLAQGNSFTGTRVMEPNTSNTQAPANNNSGTGALQGIRDEFQGIERNIPQEASPEGGISVPIRHDD